MRTVIGIGGASGAVFGVELLRRCPGDTYAILSRWGQHVLKEETGLGRAEIERLATRLFSDSDLSAPLASGSNAWDAMVVLPCSTSTVGKIASGIADSLLTRAAAVTLKERRRLVLCPRETPLSAVALRQMAALAGDGVVIMPVSPGWYGGAATLDELVADFVGRVLQVLGVEQPGGWRSGELEGASRPLPQEGGPREIRLESLDPKQVEILRRMSPEERVRRGLEWSDFVLECVRVRIRDQHPDWNEEEIGAEILRQLHGVEL